MDALPPKWFAGTSWEPWRVVLAALFGLPLVNENDAILFPDVQRRRMDLFSQLTGRTELPTAPVQEGWLIVGRRGGKSQISALIAVYLSACKSYREFLSPGERGTLMLVAADRRQARTLFRYVAAFFELTALANLVEGRTAEAIHLKNGITIEIQTRSFRSVRGYTIVGFLADEIAFWPTDESASPDAEVLDSVRPAMATIPTAMMLCISSPYARRGVLWEAYLQCYGVEQSDVLVVQAPSRVMNATLSEKVVQAAYARDDASASAEYGAEFRKDIESFVSLESIAACVVADRLELPPMAGIEYQGFVDPSGGSQDSFTLAIAHAEGRQVVLDAVRETKPPFSPETIAQEYAELLKTYGIEFVMGDRYAGEWPREQFRKHGVEYRPSDKSKSDLYRDLLPLLNATTVQLLDHPVLQTQLQGLERRCARGGKDSIDHAPGARDDVANAVAGAVVLVAMPYRTRFDAFEPTPDVELEIPTVTRGEGKDSQEIDQAVLRFMKNGTWFR
jgi:hypothetical protein